MKKIGIITHYYNSTNFGGNLQAYALVDFLQKMGFDTEQISFLFKKNTKSLKKKVFHSIKSKQFVKIIGNKIFQFPKVLWSRYEDKKYNINTRSQQAFNEFNKHTIRHSTAVFDDRNIAECIKDYDIFITGSDQVWVGNRPAFFLDFVPSNKIKMSYAACIARDFLTDHEKLIFQNYLKNYKAVSVREKRAVDLISDLSPVPVENVLDPTLLLERTDWDKISSERIVDEDYLFCYFLGENKKLRNLVECFASQNNLKLVAIPHAGGKIKFLDRNFGDIRLFDATPNDFISLIKHAKYVFTDSFHAVVFSYIYQKQYFAFNRDKGKINLRIQDITELFHSEDRFCICKARENLQYLNSINDIDYTQANPTFEKLKQESIDFLKRNLGDTEE